MHVTPTERSVVGENLKLLVKGERHPDDIRRGQHPPVGPNQLIDGDQIRPHVRLALELVRKIGSALPPSQVHPAFACLHQSQQRHPQRRGIGALWMGCEQRRLAIRILQDPLAAHSNVHAFGRMLLLYHHVRLFGPCSRATRAERVIGKRLLLAIRILDHKIPRLHPHVDSFGL
eukprot:6728625-Prymnesium_polylepis.1